MEEPQSELFVGPLRSQETLSDWQKLRHENNSLTPEISLAVDELLLSPDLIEVTFDIDTNGTFKVFAGDKSTGKENTVIITNHKTHLSNEDREHMVQEAEKYKAKEEKQWDKASSKNSLKLLAINIKANAEDKKLQVKLSNEDKQMILDKCNEIINWFHKNQTAEKEESEHQQKELEKVRSPVIPKLSQSRR
uniref:Heat shock cognate 71 kDa protein n=1 Tax=Myotis myotis TaxID=51298 RepID=A0A7J7VIJ4_MYOMY|nr:hypothetical protein mMyoMyo1_008296 [Myotis myotis]